MVSIVECVDNMEFMSRYPDGYFELGLIDPPYGIGINTNMGRRKGDKKSKYHKFFGDDLSIPPESYFRELFRVTKNQILWGGNYMTKYLNPSPCWILWDKLFSEEVTFAQYEMAWTSFNSSAKKFTYSPLKQINIIHPTQKPVDLYKWLLKNYAQPGDKILDTHMGSQSSRIAAHDMGFDYYGCELDPDYFASGCKRYEDHISQLSIF